jgi:NAD(P)-dependent dehydrogenase (short-subunit alcohol dehydrogenase family)
MTWPQEDRGGGREPGAHDRPVPGDSRSLAGRVALVTGGGTGIGAATSSLLADRGASVVIAQPDAASAASLAGQLDPTGHTIRGVGADLAVAGDCAAVVEQCLAMHGRLDILVNNAAVTGDPARGELLDFPDAQLDHIVDVNLKGTFRCSRHAARAMRAHGGVIVNIASVGAFAAEHEATAYVATKAAIVGLTRAMAFELAPLRIRVVAVAPGDIDLTAGSEPAGPSPHPGEPGAWWERRAPLGRRGTPQDIAHVVAFLASGEASYMTGETVVVDGGYLSY